MFGVFYGGLVMIFLLESFVLRILGWVSFVGGLDTKISGKVSNRSTPRSLKGWCSSGINC